MKKFIAILLIISYAGNAAGLAINYHYCGGHLAKVSFLNFEALKGCACNPNDMPKDCCKDELKYQKSDNHKTIQAVQIAEITSFAIESPFCNSSFAIPLIDKDDSSPVTNEVQRSCPEPIYLLNRVFRI